MEECQPLHAKINPSFCLFIGIIWRALATTIAHIFFLQLNIEESNKLFFRPKMAPSFDDSNSLFDFVVRKGNGVKGLADSGIEKVPEKYIQPSYERIEKIVGGSYQAPSPIDLSMLDGPHHDQVVEAIVRASETLGFFQVVNHGVPVDLLESLKHSAHRFFAQPPEEKAVYLQGVSPSPLVKYGTSFAPEKEKSLEWKDYLNMVYSNDAEALQHWPSLCK